MESGGDDIQPRSGESEQRASNEVELAEGWRLAERKSPESCENGQGPEMVGAVNQLILPLILVLDPKHSPLGGGNAHVDTCYVVLLLYCAHICSAYWASGPHSTPVSPI